MVTLAEDFSEVMDERGLKLEILDSLPVWEGTPGIQHNELGFRYYGSIRPDPGSSSRCGCFRAFDVEIGFPGGSVARPDISIFCSEQPLEGRVQTIPKAAIEITSPSTRRIDLEIKPDFYLKYGVLDVLVVDRQENIVHHWTSKGKVSFAPGRTVSLECGCLIDL